MSNSNIITLLIVGIVLSKLIIGVLIIILIRKNKQLKREKQDLANINSELSLAEEFKLKILSLATHDLRSPFIAIRMLMESKQVEHLPNESLIEFLKELEKQIIVSQKMIDDVLLWTAGQIKDVHQVKQIFNVSLKIKDIILLFQPQIKNKDIDTVCNIAGSVECKGNLEIFNFVSRNLLHNAIKYSPPKSQIKIDLSISPCGSIGQLSFRDSGIGMDEHVINSINAGGFFSHNDKDKEIESMGLGLSLCHMLTRQVKWKIKAESSLGEGSTISLFFPVKNKERILDIKQSGHHSKHTQNRRDQA